MIYFLIYLFLEVLISVNIASAIGGIATFVEIIFSALVGVGILMNFRETLSENMHAVSMKCIDLNQFQKLNLFTLFGALLLIVPGFFTDILGVRMQFTVVTKMFVNRYASKYGNCNEKNQEKKDENVIDVEIVSDTVIER